MARNILVINCDLRETRVALIEGGVIAELHLERASSRSTVGNVVLGKVTRVLPGMQAAFIDVGLERAAFLHVEDLIRPDDFDAYLEGWRASDEEPQRVVGEGGRRHGTTGTGGDEESSATPAAAATSGTQADAEEAAGPPEPAGEPAADGGNGEDAERELAETAEQEADDDSAEDGDDEDEAEDDEGDGADVDAESGDGSAVVEPAAPTEPALSEPSVTASVATDVHPMSVPGGKRRRRRRRRRGGQPEVRSGAARGANRAAQKTSLRVSRSVPITEVVKEGVEVLVQISKEPIGTKGARVTSHVSLAGRYVVYLPTVEHVGISKRIGSARERARLREVIDTVKPPKGGLIVRTVAEHLTKGQLKADIGYLLMVWQEIAKKRENARAPETLYSELDLVLKAARDLFTDEIEKIVIDDKEQHGRLVRFVEMFMPQRVKDIELYSGDEPIFDAYGIEDEIGRALSRKVPLGSGGYLIIDQAEALTAIDVNTGRFVGKGSKDLEETALKTNLEAVEEIAYQLRFRNIGGLVILDLIDMERGSNRDKVFRSLEQLLARDKAKTTINRISELGLIEMTRKRTRESLGRLMHEPCFYCDGTGQIQSRITIAYEILRQVRRERKSLPGYVVVVNAHPAVVDVLKGEEKAAVAEAERRFMRRIEFSPRREYHIEQFDLQGK